MGVERWPEHVKPWVCLRCGSRFARDVDHKPGHKVSYAPRIWEVPYGAKVQTFWRDPRRDA